MYTSNQNRFIFDTDLNNKYMEDLNEAVKAMNRGILNLTERDFIMKLQNYTAEMVRNMSVKQLEWLKRIADKNKQYG